MTRDLVQSILRDGGFLVSPEAVRESRAFFVYRARAFVAAELYRRKWTMRAIGDVIGFRDRYAIREAIRHGQQGTNWPPRRKRLIRRPRPSCSA